MGNLTLFVDLDGTLKTEHDDTGPYEVDSITVESGDKTYVLAPRPHLYEFLDFAQSKADLVLTTAGGRGYAKRVLSALNIEKYFSKIIAAQDFINGFRFKMANKYVMIDNDSEMADLKIEKLRGAFNNHADINIWVIDTYHGKKQDTTLLELKNEIGLL
jgi:hypothetical protein